MNSSYAHLPARDRFCVLLLRSLILGSELSASCRVNELSPKVIACGAYCTSIIADAHAILTLIEKKHDYSIPKILRPIIETVANIKAMINEEDFIECLVCESLLEEMKDAKKRRELFKQDFFQGKVYIDEEWFSWLKDQIDSLDEDFVKECKKIDHRKRFEKGKVGYLYLSVYAELSQFTHVRLSSTLKLLETKTVGITLFTPNPDIDETKLANWVSLAALSVCDAAECFCQFCGHPPDGRLQTIKGEIHQLQNEYTPLQPEEP